MTGLIMSAHPFMRKMGLERLLSNKVHDGNLMQVSFRQGSGAAGCMQRGAV